MAHRIVSLLLCLLAAALVPAVARAAAPECKCADKNDLLNRYREAKAAIAEYKRQIAKLGNAPFRYPKYRHDVQPDVQKAINVVTNGAANRVAGGTDAGTCERKPNTVNSGKQTACIAKAIEIHEGVHRSACEDWKLAEGPFRGNDYRKGQSMAKFLNEEIAAYQAEIEFIKQQFDASCPLGWTVDFDVTVIGEGSKATNSLSSIQWKVSHKYSGTVDLVLGVPIPSLKDGTNPTPAELIAGTYARMWTVLGSPTTSIDVAIDDRIVQYSKDPGEGDAYEATTTTSTWKGSGKDAASGSPILEIDERGELYSANIPFRPTATTKPLAVVVKESIDRTQYGYGGAPTHEERTPTNTKNPFSVMQIPDISGVIAGGRVERKKKALAIVNDSFEYTDTFAPPKSYMAGMPDVQKSLKVRVHYRFTRIELD
ncbi:MAG TPA: hypothetical protein VG755_15225 [Nannocystaceae bacterium]|nr:hypothetical protein [Nannocystaceae bacterium]